MTSDFNTYLHIFYWIDWCLFLYLLLMVSYLLFFTGMSFTKNEKYYKPSTFIHKFVILIPAYKEDSVIIDTVKTFLKQDYPTEQYDLVVIADKMKQETIESIKQYPVHLLEVHFESSTKAKALKYALEHLPGQNYQIVVVLDADNHTDRNYLSQINDAYNAGCMAIQTHRMAKKTNTTMAFIDAVSEEINNTIFRKGHIRAGLSSALIGSGMAFDFNLFHQCIMNADLNNVGEDKQLEISLLRKFIFIDYLENTNTYDEKITQTKAFYNQRRRWLATQFSNLLLCINDLPKAILNKNWSYCDKLFQWIMPSRIMLVGYIFILTLITFYFDWFIALKWLCLLFISIMILLISIPKYLQTKKLYKTVFLIPLLFIMMFINHFRLFGASKRFIHTSHGNK